MKNIVIIFNLIFLFSCQENERLVYDSNMHDIYFSDVVGKRDSLYFSLLRSPDISSVYLDVKLLGDRLTKTKRFKVEVIKEKTTAQQDIHYRLPSDFYEFPIDTFIYKLPIELLKGDALIEKQPVILALRLLPTDELGIAYEDRAEIRLIFANMLRRPMGTEYYEDMGVFNKLFGEYSQKKHMMIIELTNHDFWDGNYGSNGGKYGLYYEEKYYIPYARKLYKIITENEIRDENGKLMTGWMVP